MLALYLKLSITHYTENYADIIGLSQQSIAREQFVLIFIMSIPNSVSYLIPYWVMVGPGLLVWLHLAFCMNEFKDSLGF